MSRVPASVAARVASRRVASCFSKPTHAPALGERYAGIQGTSTPTYYRVLLNECRIKPLDVIDLTLVLHFACACDACHVTYDALLRAPLTQRSPPPPPPPPRAREVRVRVW